MKYPAKSVVKPFKLIDETNASPRDKHNNRNILFVGEKNNEIRWLGCRLMEKNLHSANNANPAAWNPEVFTIWVYVVHVYVRRVLLDIVMC